MTAETLTTMRELDARVTDGIQVRLLWRATDSSVWVSVMDTRGGDAFCLRVRSGERAQDVFHHPFAYAAVHGVSTSAGPRPEAADPPHVTV